MIKVKICGLTNLADAQAAVAAGADLVGFVFYEPSPRYLPIEQAAEICRELPPHVVRTGVFVDPSADTVMRAVAECGLNLLQFHGAETPEFCRGFGVMSMKAFRVRDAQSLARVREYATDAWLLDAWMAGQPGGTGATFNWDLAREACRWGRPVFLAGGLTPENVAAAVRQVQPYGVDVSSGVETVPGRKDHARVRAFIEAAKTVTKKDLPSSAF
jgi:phosphoribosylanthranilate isomerase